MRKTSKPGRRARLARPQEALESLRQIRRLVAQKDHPFKHMTKEQVVDAIKRKRNARWEAKFAHSS